jgi:hypothetical protein
LAKEFGMGFFETSARSGANVNETFFHIAKIIKDKQNSNLNQQVKASDSDPTRKSSVLRKEGDK